MPPRRVPMIIGAILPVPYPENLVLTLAQAATLLNTTREALVDLGWDEDDEEVEQ